MLSFAIRSLRSSGPRAERGPRVRTRALVLALALAPAAVPVEAPQDSAWTEELEALRSLDPRVSAPARERLRAGGPEALRAALTPPLPPEAWARRARVELFEPAGTAEWVPALVPFAEDPDATVRCAAFRALGARRLFDAPPLREEILRVGLEDPDPDAARCALVALGGVDRPHAARTFVEALVEGSARPRAELLRAFVDLRSARPLLLELLQGIDDAELGARRVLAPALGRASVHALAEGRLPELGDRIARDLTSGDAGLRRGGESALFDLDFELRGVHAYAELQAELRRLRGLAPQVDSIHRRLVILSALHAQDRAATAAEIAAWRGVRPDPRTSEGGDAELLGEEADGIAALLARDGTAASRAFARAATSARRQLVRLPADPWGGWPIHLRLPVERRGEVGNDPAELLGREEAVAALGLPRERPVHHFDLRQIGLLREEARARLLRAFAGCLDPGIALEVDEEVGLAFDGLLEGYEASVLVEGYSFRARERLPDFGENVDLVFDGELGLYAVLQGLIRCGRADELPAALERFGRALERHGDWVGRELAAPEAFETEPPVLDIDAFLRYRRRNPSRFRIVQGQILLDQCGRDDLALAVYERAARGYEAATRDWPWAARLQAQAILGAAGCQMARRDADAAEAGLVQGIAALEELLARLEARDGPGGGDWLLPDLSSLYVSRAVNDNVLRGRPEVAERWMLRALQLDPSDFNLVLGSCYLARGGKVEEARAVLARVPPQPALAYNLGCTYALLGDAERAFEFLAQDLDENHATDAARRQQGAWAWEDPDLAGLREDSRFERLYGPRPR